MAMAPVHAAFRALWPDARVEDLLDTSLSPDGAAEWELTPGMSGRVLVPARYAAGTGAQGIKFTCSAFGPAIAPAAAALAPIPVLKPDEAMFAEALTRGRRLGMLATFGPSLGTMEEEFAESAQGRAVLETVLVAPALAALWAGDEVEHDHLLAEAAPRHFGCDAVLLAHFRTSRARAAVAAALPGCSVLAAPDAAVRALRTVVTGRDRA